MSWSLRFSEQAEKELSKLDKSVQKSIKKYMAEVCALADPGARGHSLTGPWAGFHRYRVGQLRIIARLQNNIVTITIVTIGRRDSVYGA